MRIVFCNIAYMKNYCEINDDKPANDGSWIVKYVNGGETYNFYNYNGQCYGNFKADGETTHIENIDGISVNDSFAENVLVIWVAKK